VTIIAYTILRCKTSTFLLPPDKICHYKSFEDVDNMRLNEHRNFSVARSQPRKENENVQRSHPKRTNKKRSPTRLATNKRRIRMRRAQSTQAPLHVLFFHERRRRIASHRRTNNERRDKTPYRQHASTTTCHARFNNKLAPGMEAGTKPG